LRTSNKHWVCEGRAALAVLVALAALACCGAAFASNPATAPSPAPAPAQAGSLCLESEPVVFACSVRGKLVSLCRGPGAGLHYRFGSPVSLELEYPAPGQRARPAFSVRSAPLIGGGLTSVVFVRSGYTYTVYSRVTRGPDGTPAFEDGVTVERRGRTLKHLQCEDGGAGFREPPSPSVK